MALADRRSAEVADLLPAGVPLPRPVTHLPVLVARADGTVIDTVATVSTQNRAMLVLAPATTDADGRTHGRMWQRWQPFSDYPLMAVDPGGQRLIVAKRSVWTGEGELTFTLHLLDPLRLAPSRVGFHRHRCQNTATRGRRGSRSRRPLAQRLSPPRPRRRTDRRRGQRRAASSGRHRPLAGRGNGVAAQVDARRSRQEPECRLGRHLSRGRSSAADFSRIAVACARA